MRLGGQGSFLLSWWRRQVGTPVSILTTTVSNRAYLASCTASSVFVLTFRGRFRLVPLGCRASMLNITSARHGNLPPRVASFGTSEPRGRRGFSVGVSENNSTFIQLSTVRVFLFSCQVYQILLSSFVFPSLRAYLQSVSVKLSCRLFLSHCI